MTERTLTTQTHQKLIFFHFPTHRLCIGNIRSLKWAIFWVVLHRNKRRFTFHFYYHSITLRLELLVHSIYLKSDIFSIFDTQTTHWKYSFAEMSANSTNFQFQVSNWIFWQSILQKATDFTNCKQVTVTKGNWTTMTVTCSAFHITFFLMTLFPIRIKISYSHRKMTFFVHINNTVVTDMILSSTRSSSTELALIFCLFSTEL